MSNKIDFSFISALEGGQHLKGYVPAAGVSKSGVTVGTGFDLGARNEADLKRLALGAPLREKLKPYLGKKAADAKALIKKSPLTITQLEADEIDKAVKSAATKKLISAYDLAVGTTSPKFASLIAAAQTVIASVSYQYGDLAKKAPKFWKAATAQDWPETIKILKNFGDAYRTRRGKEAALLEKATATAAAAAPTAASTTAAAATAKNP